MGELRMGEWMLRLRGWLPGMLKASALALHERTIQPEWLTFLEDKAEQLVEGAADLATPLRPIGDAMRDIAARMPLPGAAPAAPAPVTSQGKLLPISNSTYTGIAEGKTERIVPVADLLARFSVDGLIRLRQGDYNRLRPVQGRFVNFNLEKTTNEVQRRYAIVAIKRPGHRDQAGREVLPILDPDRFRIGKCIEVRQHVPLEAVVPADFAASLPTLRTRRHLETFLVKRYAKMHPELSRAELLERGCAITTLSFD